MEYCTSFGLIQCVTRFAPYSRHKAILLHDNGIAFSQAICLNVEYSVRSLATTTVIL